MVELQQAFTSARAAWDMVQAAMKKRDHSLIEKAVTEMRASMAELSTIAASLGSQVLQLQSELQLARNDLRQAQEALAERRKYLLREIMPGRYAYSAKANPDTGEPQHYLCQICYDGGLKTVLVLIKATAYGNGHWSCGRNTNHAIHF